MTIPKPIKIGDFERDTWVIQICLKFTVESDDALWLHAHDQIFGTLKPGVACLWKRPADIAQIPRITIDEVIIKVASIAANLFAHLTDFMYDKRTTSSQRMPPDRNTNTQCSWNAGNCQQNNRRPGFSIAPSGYVSSVRRNSMLLGCIKHFH